MTCSICLGLDLPQLSIVGAPDIGKGGFVDGVADVELEVPLASEGGDCGG